MKSRILKLIIFFIIICIGAKINVANAAEESANISLNASSEKVANNEKFEIMVGADNSSIAACTLWIYYENEKVECNTNNDNINVLEDKIIYTWYSSSGKNEKMNDILNLEFTAKNEGIATFAITGEIYNENGEEISFNGDSIDIEIGDTIQEDELQELTEEVQKDENSLNLGILRTNYESIVPDFSENIFEYYLVVDEAVNNIDITAIPESKKAEVVISGNKNLKMGLNIIKITVSLNGDSKTYTINVTKTRNEAAANTNLETLAVEYYELEPEYSGNITNYHIEIPNTESTINILAIPEDKNAKVKISGNDNLQYGINSVTVEVTAKDGITVKRYNIEVYKRNKEEEAKYQEEVKKKVEEANNLLAEKNIETTSMNSLENREETSNNNGRITIIVVLTLAVIAIGIVIIIIRKKKNNIEK